MSHEVLPLTIIILTHTSNRLFLRCLASAQLAAEVIVVDNNSKNNWSQLATTYNFSVLRHPEPISDFAATRNQALKRAEHPWVLFLDSDEVLAENSFNELKQCLHSETVDGFFVLRLDSFLGKALYWGEAAQLLLRLVKKDATVFERPVHEEAVVDGRIADSNIIIKHYAHRSISEFIVDVANYSKSEGEYRFNQLKQPFSLLFLLAFPLSKFLTNYFARLAFFDGWRGFIYCLIMSIHSTGVRMRQYELSQE